MKRLFVLLAALCLIGTASAQVVPPIVPDTPPTPRFRAPVGIKDIPRQYSEEALSKTPPAAEMPKVYEEALETYEEVMRQREAVPQRPVFPPDAPVDCDMIIWADTTTTAPMPTLTPDPNIDPNMPMLGQDREGCPPPASLRRLPDSLRMPQFPLKKYPMKFREK